MVPTILVEGYGAMSRKNNHQQVNAKHHDQDATNYRSVVDASKYPVVSGFPLSSNTVFANIAMYEVLNIISFNKKRLSIDGNIQ